MHARLKSLICIIIVFCSFGFSHATDQQQTSQQGKPLPWWEQENPPLFDSQRWEKAIQAFENQDRATPPPEGAIVAIGSSSMRFWHGRIHIDLSPLTIILRGFGGSTMNDALHYADRIVIPYKPRAVILYEGDNDIGIFRISPEQIRETFNDFVEKIHNALPQSRIYVISIKPSIARWNDWPQMREANRLLKAACESNVLLTYIDVASSMLDENQEPQKDIYLEDMLHLNAKGYEIWASAIRPVLLKSEAGFESSKQEAR